LPSPRKPGLTLSLGDEKSLWREPRWNADRCAPPALRGAAGRWRGIRALRLSAFRFRDFLSVLSFLSSLPDSIRQSMQKSRSRGAFHRLSCDDAVLRTAMSGGDESGRGLTVAWHSSGALSRAARTIFVRPHPPSPSEEERRENGLSLRAQRSGAKQSILMFRSRLPRPCRSSRWQARLPPLLVKENEEKCDLTRPLWPVVCSCRLRKI